MATKQRTPAVSFDDISGELPTGTVPDDVDLELVAKDAIAKLNNLTPEDLTDNALWRDLLSFTGTYRTFYSGSTVLATLQRLSSQKRRGSFRLRGGDPRIARSLGDISWIDIDLSFDTEADGIVAHCEGTVSVVRREDNKWQIWMLRTWLESFDGHGHPDILDPETKHAHDSPEGSSKEHVSGVADDLPQTSHKSNQQYDAIVVGGGQAGLSVAGRLKALHLSYIVLERRPEIGDVWNTRYESLRWHTSKEYGNLPFGHTYPADDDYMLPARRIGAGHKAWSENYGINVRTSTSVDSAAFDDSANMWTITAASSDGHQTLKARNLILAIGPGHLTPVVPEWASPERIESSKFKGTIKHSSSYHSIPASLVGGRGIVVGTANTGHDVAEDSANASMDTTMIQRGATFILPMEWLHHAQNMHYNASMHPAEADRESFTYPNKILRDMINRGTWSLVGQSPDRFDALEKAGFKIERYGDIYHNMYVRFGGHYVDIGASARIANGEIKIKTQSVTSLTETGVLFEDGSELPADLIVLATGFDHDFRKDAAKIVGKDVAEQMDDYWGVDAEGEVRGFAKLAGHPQLYYLGGDVRTGRFFSRFIALQIQADAIGMPLQQYLD
ncbi:hypothetical protein LTR08_004164 [Meristemomyces frigidus]|nr:hypothetical protein LTR08_004164 [Meristemomyces frigidus]